MIYKIEIKMHFSLSFWMNSVSIFDILIFIPSLLFVCLLAYTLGLCTCSKETACVCECVTERDNTRMRFFG